VGGDAVWWQVSTVLRAAAAQADGVLESNSALLEEMVEELLRAEVLEGDVLEAFLARAVLPAQYTTWLKS